MAIERDWYACEGYGAPEQASTSAKMMISRRNLLVALGLGSLTWGVQKTALSQITVNPRHDGHVLVSIFLRGGADGLNIVAPVGEDAYHRARPTIRLTGKEALDLDGFFAINARLDPLLPHFRNGDLAIVHAVGSFDHTRSHFEAMNTMERGLASGSIGAASGWIARYLAATEAGKPSPMRAISIGGTMPDSLRGSNAISVGSIEEFKLNNADEAFTRALKEMYGSSGDAMKQAGKETLSVLDTLNRLDMANSRASNGAVYPASDLGRALQQVSTLIRADVGLEVAVLDKGGWDTHVAQGGLLPTLLDDLGASLSAFAADLGSELSRVTVVVQTEFGRRVEENSGAGTDHGRASCMFILGGGVRGGKVYADWPSLAPEHLEGPGDLRVTTDYRSVLSQVLDVKTGADSTKVFGQHPAASFRIYS